MTLAKGLGSGLPIGMVVAKKSLMESWQRGSHGNTYGGNPVCCAAALATLDLVSSEYCANAARMGEYFIGKLRELQGKYACIGDVRGKGLMLGMELVEDRTTKVPASKLTEKLIRQCYQNGMLLLSCGQSTIRFMPPLNGHEGTRGRSDRHPRRQSRRNADRVRRAIRTAVARLPCSRWRLRPSPSPSASRC